MSTERFRQGATMTFKAETSEPTSMIQVAGLHCLHVMLSSVQKKRSLAFVEVLESKVSDDMARTWL